MKEKTNIELINRIALFDDSNELAAGLWHEAELSEEMTGEYAYYMKEAAVHIEGMWRLVKDLKRRIELNDKQAK